MRGRVLINIGTLIAAAACVSGAIVNGRHDPTAVGGFLPPFTPSEVKACHVNPHRMVVGPGEPIVTFNTTITQMDTLFVFGGSPTTGIVPVCAEVSCTGHVDLICIAAVQGVWNRLYSYPDFGCYTKPFANVTVFAEAWGTNASTFIAAGAYVSGHGACAVVTANVL